jgi:AraC-like DNA-binding protein
MGKPTADLARGVSVEIVGAVAAALGVKPPPATDGFVSGPDADGLLDDAAGREGDEAIGLALASRIPMGGLGLLDYALCTSPDVRAALSKVANYYAMVSQRVALTLEDEPPRAALVLERRPGIPHNRHWIEFSFAAMTARVRQTTGRPIPAPSVSFAHASSASADTYRAFFGGPVSFDAPSDRLELPPGALDLPLLTAAASLAELLEAKIRELEPVRAADHVAGRVRRTVVSLLDDGEPVDVRAVAARMKMSSRTLQRLLTERASSLTVLVDDVRRERALALLSVGSASMSDVSDRLGFASPSAFFRAFRRWTGTTPRGFRRSRRT